MAVAEAPRLGCGRSIDRIWATIDQPATAHEQQCELCQAARDRLAKLGDATRSLRDSDLHDAALKPRPRVKDAIMEVARAEVRRGRRLLLHSKMDGTTEVSEQALSSVIRFAAAQVPGIHARRCHIDIYSTSDDGTGDAHLPINPDTGAEAGPRLVVSLRVAVAPNIDIPRTVDSLRERISTAIAACVGINAGTINIIVEDLYNV